MIFFKTIQAFPIFPVLNAINFNFCVVFPVFWLAIRSKKQQLSPIWIQHSRALEYAPLSCDLAFLFYTTCSRLSSVSYWLCWECYAMLYLVVSAIKNGIALDRWCKSIKDAEHESVATAQKYLAGPPVSPILLMEQYMFRKMCYCNTDVAMIWFRVRRWWYLQSCCKSIVLWIWTFFVLVVTITQRHYP